MYLRMPQIKLAGLATIFALALAPLQAQDVTLKSTDGTVSVSGTLLEFDGNVYRVRMLLGEISIDASQVVCEGEGCPNLMAGITEFSVAGSNSIGANLLPTLIEVYALERGGDMEVSISEDGNSVYNVLEPDGSVYATIFVNSSDTVDGFVSLLEGSATIGMASRPANGDELAAFELSGKGNLSSPENEWIIALDGVIAAVNRDNPVKILSLAQIAGIFAGEITNWNQVGGNDASISLYRRDTSSGTTAAFATLAMAESGQSFASNARVLDTDAAVSDAVSGDPNGIGLTSYAQERSAQMVAIRSVCGQLFDASDFTIKTEEYPLTRRLHLYTSSGAIPDVATEFLDFATSSAAQSVIANAGFIGQNPSRASLDQQGRRMAQAIVSSAGRAELLQLQDLTSNLLNAERLSFTLRFGADGNLDSRAVADITQLAGMIRNGEFSSRQILIFGFSDNTGGVNAQLGSTQDMAVLARDAIINATGRANLGNVRISPIGYGRLLPLGCNETPFGRASNNRVEIWVK